MIWKAMRLALVVITLCCCGGAAVASVPQTISYQGYVSDNTGRPVSSPAKAMGFALYSTSTGGVPLWNEQQDVKVDNGIYTVELGTVTPLSLPFDTRYFLGVTVPPDGEMTPRTPLAAVPYSFRSGTTGSVSLACQEGGVLVFKEGTWQCGTVMTLPNAAAVCVGPPTITAAGCAISMCSPGWGNCNSQVPDGCETDIASNLANCGSCGVVCPTQPNMTSSCSLGVCSFGTCLPGWGDCNSFLPDGCEMNLDSSPSNCGACGVICTSGICSNGTCLQTQGSACSTDNQCVSGFCSDGVCCEARCGSTCEACNQSGRVGFCDPIPNGADPGNECTAQSVSTCGTNGMCSGSRSCAFYPNGTISSAALCSGSTLTLASTCNGIGASMPGGSTSCAPYVCNGISSCKTFCSINADCVSGYACQGGVCKKNHGTACASNGECFSGFCTDGYCCESACTGTCEKCSQSGRQGFCDPLPAGTDPDNECNPLACNGSRACQ